MKPHDPSEYGERIADVYDDLFAGGNPGPAVDRLAALAGDGRVLELGVGTGRLALPLRQRGLPVEGIEASPAMLARLRAKPGGAEMKVHAGDFADVGIDGETPCSLVFVAFNTLFALITQDDQVRCFANVARRLGPGGRFVVEAFVPDLARFDRGQRLSTDHLGVDALWLEASQHDPVGQRVRSRHVRVAEDGVRLFPTEIRYAWPSELDLMARLAGLELEHRWGWWDGRPFTASSGMHVSTWRRPG